MRKGGSELRLLTPFPRNPRNPGNPGNPGMSSETAIPLETSSKKSALGGPTWDKIFIFFPMAIFLIIGFVNSTPRVQVKDGGLSFGDFYITRSWEED